MVPPSNPIPMPDRIDTVFPAVSCVVCRLTGLATLPEREESKIEAVSKTFWYLLYEVREPFKNQDIVVEVSYPSNMIGWIDGNRKLDFALLSE